jgi:hypothetical protein
MHSLDVVAFDPGDDAPNSRGEGNHNFQRVIRGGLTTIGRPEIKKYRSFISS